MTVHQPVPQTIDPPRAVPLLEARHVVTEFATPGGQLRAVDDVSFSLVQGETLGIVGESGSGKSVLVRTIMNLLDRSATVSPDTEIMFGGRDVLRMSTVESKHFWGTEMAMVFQDPMTSLNPVKRIGVQLTESMRFHLGLNASKARSKGLDLLAQVGIPDPVRRLDQYPHELSGGMRQRVTIAIALSCEPRLLIADEPTTALDVTVQKQILDLLDQLQAERGMSMILITHDLGVVAGHADRVALMYAGQFVESASTEDMFHGTLHPYAEALLASIPRVEHPSHTRLDAIPGRPPNMASPPPGCRFAPRCSHVRDECAVTMPQLTTGGSERGCGDGAHLVRCLFPLGSDTVGNPSRRGDS